MHCVTMRARGKGIGNRIDEFGDLYHSGYRSAKLGGALIYSTFKDQRKKDGKRARAESAPFRGGKEKGRNPTSPSFPLR